MRKLQLTKVFFSALGVGLIGLQAVAGETFKPKDRDQFECRDTLTAKVYRLEITDLSDDGGKVEILDSSGARVRQNDASHEVEVVDYLEGLEFRFVEFSDRIDAVIDFSRYDLSEVTHYSAGRNHPMTCAKLR